MNKVKRRQREREIEVYEWALSAAAVIMQRSICTVWMREGTDIELHWAEILTEEFDKVQEAVIA